MITEEVKMLNLILFILDHDQGDTKSLQGHTKWQDVNGNITFITLLIISLFFTG